MRTLCVIAAVIALLHLSVCEVHKKTETNDIDEGKRWGKRVYREEGLDDRDEGKRVYREEGLDDRDEGLDDREEDQGLDEKYLRTLEEEDTQPEEKASAGELKRDHETEDDSQEKRLFHRAVLGDNAGNEGSSSNSKEKRDDDDERQVEKELDTDDDERDLAEDDKRGGPELPGHGDSMEERHHRYRGGRRHRGGRRWRYHGYGHYFSTFRYLRKMKRFCRFMMIIGAGITPRECFFSAKLRAKGLRRSKYCQTPPTSPLQDITDGTLNNFCQEKLPKINRTIRVMEKIKQKFQTGHMLDRGVFIAVKQEARGLRRLYPYMDAKCLITRSLVHDNTITLGTHNQKDIKQEIENLIQRYGHRYGAWYMPSKELAVRTVKATLALKWAKLQLITKPNKCLILSEVMKNALYKLLNHWMKSRIPEPIKNMCNDSHNELQTALSHIDINQLPASFKNMFQGYKVPSQIPPQGQIESGFKDLIIMLLDCMQDMVHEAQGCLEQHVCNPLNQTPVQSPSRHDVRVCLKTAAVAAVTAHHNIMTLLKFEQNIHTFVPAQATP